MHDIASFRPFSPATAGWQPFDAQGRVKRDERDADGENGMVASSNIYATRAGLQVLMAGGNAVDAAVAVSYALGVAEPMTSGIGGGGFMTIHTSGGEDIFIDYREVAPAAQTAFTWLDADGRVRGESNHIGGLAVGVPGEVAGMELARRAYGSGRLSRGELLEPAIELARTGYVVSPTLTRAVEMAYPYMTGDMPVLGAYYLRDQKAGVRYRVGDVLRNPDLARTLSMIATDGEEVFYRGEIGAALVREAGKYGGLLSMEDLAAYRPRVRRPVRGTYRGYPIITAPPASSGGTHIVEGLNILENFDVGSLPLNGPAYLHMFSEVFKACFADRTAYMADTDFARVPLAGLTDKRYAAAIASRVDRQASKPWTPGPAFSYEPASTTSFSVADRAGNIVTVTQTIECFWGSKVAVPDYGFILNDEMHDFATDPTSVNRLEPGKRSLSSMSPTVVLRPDGRPFLSVGSPGGVRIWPTLIQVISHVIDHGLDIQDAIDTARIFDDGAADHSAGGGFCYESGGVRPVGEESVRALREMGHAPTDMGAWNLFFGGVQAILFREDGSMRGAADPRRDGKALGF